MSDQRDEQREERELAALFESSAEQPSQPDLTKLRARAAEIPARVRRRRMFWVFAPAFAGALAVGLLVLHQRAGVPGAAVLTARAPSARQSAAPELTGPAPAPTLAVAPSAEPPMSAEPASELAIDDVDDLDDLDDGAGVNIEIAATGLDTELGTEADGVEALYEPPPDADLDAWLRATDDLLKGGG